YITDSFPPDFYTLSLHDALPISIPCSGMGIDDKDAEALAFARRKLEFAKKAYKTESEAFAKTVEDAFDKREADANSSFLLAKARDRKSTRLNSSHSQISYAVFCL